MDNETGRAERCPTQWMMMPRNSDYSEACHLHVRDGWCDKVGCTPISEACAKKILDSSEGGQIMLHPPIKHDALPAASTGTPRAEAALAKLEAGKDQK